jgi:hypothetical protein
MHFRASRCRLAATFVIVAVALLLNTVIATAQTNPTQNLQTCLDGRYAALCDRSQLTRDQRQQADVAERRANFELCRSGQYMALCRKDLLTAEQRHTVDAAERQANFELCRSGQYAALCHKDLLTAEQRRTVDAAERRYNLSVCKDGRLAALCRRDLLTPDERVRAAEAERHNAQAAKPIPRAQPSTRPVQACYEATIRSPSPFLGNHDEVVHLSDGSIWQVQYEYNYLYAFFPSIVICPGMGRLLVNGKSLNVRALSESDQARTAAPTPTGEVIESRIDGEFEGWSGDTIFRLVNGQIWQQSGYAYLYHYGFMLPVLIYPAAGGYRMQVEGVSDQINVTRLR